MRSISETRFLSENYGALHGLNAVPLGLGLFLTSLWANLVHYPVKSFALPIALALVCLGLSIAADRYYKQAFGEIKPRRLHRRLYWIAQGAAGLLGLAAFWADVSFHLPVSFIGLLFASIFLLDKPAVSIPLNKFSSVRLVTAICIILASIAPLFLGRSWWEMLGVRSSLLGVTMLVGALIVLQGVIWHFFFVASLPAREARDE